MVSRARRRDRRRRSFVSARTAAALPVVARGGRPELRRAHELVLVSPSHMRSERSIVVQWLAVLALALTVEHNGWLYLRRRRPALALHRRLSPRPRLHLPATFVGYGWSILLLPSRASPARTSLPRCRRSSSSTPLVLLPVALLCVYAIAARIAGRIFGYFAAALWIALPYFGHPLRRAGLPPEVHGADAAAGRSGSRPCPTSRRWWRCWYRPTSACAHSRSPAG